jgi:hypothetical protein
VLALLLPPPAVSISTSPSRSRGSSSSIVMSLRSSHHRAVPRRRVGRALHHPLFTIAPSIAAHRFCALGPSPPRSRRPTPSRSHRAVPRRQGAVAPSIAVTHHAPPRPLIWMVATLPLLTPPPSICRRLSLRHRHLSLLSIRLVVMSRRFSHRHLPSAGASHHAVASCHGIIKEEGVGASGDDNEQ